MRESRGWIFSPTLDICLFGLPCAFLALDYAKYAGTPLDRTMVLWPFMGYSLIFIFFNGFHSVASICFGFTTAKEYFFQFKHFLWILLAIAIYVNGYYWQPAWALTTLLLLSQFHFIRQQFGWVSIVNKKLALRPEENLRSTRAIYLITIGSCLLRQVNPWASKNFFPERLLQFPSPTLFWVLFCGLSALALISISKDLFFYRDQQPHFARALQLVSTYLCWTIAFGFWGQSWAMIMLHAVPYMYVVMKSLVDKKEPLYVTIIRLSGIYVFLLVATVLIYFGTGFTQQTQNIWDTAAFGLFATLMLFHYYWDTSIWRLSRPENQSMARLLGVS